MIRRIICIVAWYILCTCAAGCTTPLSDTTYPIIADDGLIGQWALTTSTPADDEQNQSPILIEVTRLKDQGRAVRLGAFSLGMREHPDALKRHRAPNESTDARYAIHFVGDAELDDAVAGPELIAQVIRAQQATFLTFQASARDTGYPFNLLSTPLQYTLRIDRDDDVVRLWVHKHRLLLWTPMDVAGTADLDLAPERSHDDLKRVLVGRFDDIIRSYAEAHESQWELLATGRRVLSTP